MHRMTAMATVAGLVIGAGAGVHAAGKASGYFRMDKLRTTFAHACAFRVLDPASPSGTTHVVLSSVPLDCEAADRSFSPVEALKAAAEAKKPALVTLSFPAGGAVTRIEHGSWESADPVDSFSFGGQGTVTMQANTETVTTGRYAVAKPESFFDKTFQFDFSWDTPVLSGSMAGTPVKGDGGEIGAAYRRYLAAVAKGDLAAVRANATTERAGSIPDVKGSEAQRFAKLMQAFELKTATIIGGVQRGDDAVLLVQGLDFDKMAMHGRVVMRRDAGTWKVVKVSLQPRL